MPFSVLYNLKMPFMSDKIAATAFSMLISLTAARLTGSSFISFSSSSVLVLTKRRLIGY